MRIIVLNFEYPPLGGGASPVCHEINKRYVRSGHHVTVITMLHKGLKRSEVIDGVEIIRVPSLRRHVHISRPYEQLTYLIIAWSFLKTYLREHSFDVCHAHFMLPTGWLCLRLKKKFGIPYCITAHGSDIPGFNPDRFKFLHLWTPPMIRSVARSASYITSPSNYLAGLIRKVVQDTHHKIKIIPNGIDTVSYHTSEKENIIVSSGRLLPRKGFADLIAAVSNPALPVEVHILGDGPIRHDLEKMAADSKTPVFLYGWVDNRSETYKNMLATASIYSLVSSRENASISILEAMASGCAIITSNESGCPEMVKEAGILVPHGKPEALRKAIITILENPDLRLALSQKALERAHKMYDCNTIVAQFEGLLQLAIDQNKA